MFEVKEFLAQVQPDRRHREAAQLNIIFREVTGWQPKLWRGGMLGYGTYDCSYASGRSGTFTATGFALSKTKLSIYVMPGCTGFGDALMRLGRYIKGKSCLYMNKPDDAYMTVLKELIRAGLVDPATYWPVHPT